jgi:hypothetical protein
MKTVVQYRVVDQESGRAMGPWGSYVAAQTLRKQLLGQHPWRTFVIVDDDPYCIDQLITALGY